MTRKLGARATSFWADLKERRVVSTTIAYVVGAAIVVEGTALVADLMSLPVWVPRAVLVISVLALPLVIALAWIFNIERTGAVTRDAAPSVDTAKSVKIERANVPPILSSAIASVAVLPFDNLSDDKEFGYLAEGISQELHSALAKVHRLRVAARTGKHIVSGGDDDVREIANKLSVQFIISGSVRRVGEHMRIIVELDNAVEGVQIWAETYDREIDDLFSVQRDIANGVASEFGGARLREEIESAARYPTENLDAWSLVQRARSYVVEFTPSALANAVQLLRQAILLDPEYVAAHAALASAIAEQTLNGLVTDEEANQREALASSDIAYSRSPGDPFVLKMCGAVSALFGDTQKSLEELRRAVQIAPFDYGAWGYMGWALVEANDASDLDELHEIMERIIHAAPHHPGVPYWQYHRSAAFTCGGDFENAVYFAHKSIEQNPTFPWGWMHYANALSMNDKEKEAGRAIRRCNAISPGLTPAYFTKMLRKMTVNETYISRRTEGLLKL